MSKVKIGSARKDENGKYSGGKPGDQTGIEVSMQDFYVHTKGWYVIRANDEKVANKLANLMKKACNNDLIGYSQSDRNSIIKCGVDTKVACNCDCSSLVREIVKEATGKDPGDFSTGTEKTVLSKMGLFEISEYYDGFILLKGDILVTKTKGHTVIVIVGEMTRKEYEKIKPNIQSPVNDYYKKYDGNQKASLDLVFKYIGVESKYIGSWTSRKPVAQANGIKNYTGSADHNGLLKQLATKGILKRVP